MSIRVWLAYLIVISSGSRARADENIIVHTTYGDVLGYQTNMARVFSGIPYAQPPIGELRFVEFWTMFCIGILYLIIRWNPPVPVSKWAPSVINATERFPACPQPHCNPQNPLCPPVVSIVFRFLVITTSVCSFRSHTVV